jgi:hypothetical protein
MRKPLRRLFLLLAMGAFAALPCTASAATGYRGIAYLLPVGKNVTDPKPAEALRNPNVTAGFIRAHWDEIEPSPGQFDWSYLDNNVAGFAKLGMPVKIGIIAGNFAPTWIGSQLYTTTGGNGQNACRSVTVPLPWDEKYIAAYIAFTKAFAAHFASNPDVAAIELTQISSDTAETELPNNDGTEMRPRVRCPPPNDTEGWRAAGYTGKKVLAAWEKMTDAIAEAFPKQVLVMASSDRAFPKLGDNGEADERGAALSARMFTYGHEKFGDRFWASQNGFRPNHFDAQLMEWARAGNPWGGQPAWPIKKCMENGVLIPLDTGDCTQSTLLDQLYDQLESVPGNPPKYWEAMYAQLADLGSQPALKKLHDYILGAGR